MSAVSAGTNQADTLSAALAPKLFSFGGPLSARSVPERRPASGSHALVIEQCVLPTPSANDTSGS